MSISGTRSNVFFFKFILIYQEYLNTKDLIGDIPDDFDNNNYDITINNEEECEYTITSLNQEYDNCIHELHRRLQIAKEERKRSEMDTKILQHRVLLLNNQEKIAMKRYERTKVKLDQIVQNRKFMNYSNNLSQAVKEDRERQMKKLKENVNTKREKMRNNTSGIFNSFDRSGNGSKDLKVLNQIRKNNSSQQGNYINREMNRKNNENLIRKQEEQRKQEIVNKLFFNFVVRKKNEIKRRIIEKNKGR